MILVVLTIALLSTDYGPAHYGSTYYGDGPTLLKAAVCCAARSSAAFLCHRNFTATPRWVQPR